MSFKFKQLTNSAKPNSIFWNTFSITSKVVHLHYEKVNFANILDCSMYLRLTYLECLPITCPPCTYRFYLG